MATIQETRLPSQFAHVWPVVFDARSGFPAVSVEDFRLLQDAASSLRFADGQSIFNQGDRAEHAYRVVSGAVRICKHLADGRRQIAQFVLPGEFFCFNEIDQHDFTAEAIGATILNSYPHRVIDRLSGERAGLRRFFDSLLWRCVREIEEHLVVLGQETAREKIASFLIMLLGKSEVSGGRTIHMPVSRNDTADFLGLTPETVCRVLSLMKHEALISMPGAHRVVIRDLEGLRAIAEGDDVDGGTSTAH